MAERTVLVNKRNYGIDALRIISMFMIVLFHVVGHGIGLWRGFEGTKGMYLILSFIEMTTVCAVNCYGLISGYVGVHSKYKVSNLAVLWLQVVLYSVTISIILKILQPDNISTKDIVLSFFPVLSSQYWYFTSYFILFLFIPILNHALHHVDKKLMGCLLGLIVLFVSVLGPITNTLFGWDVFYLKGGFSPSWLMILYLLGGYISKYHVLEKRKKSCFVIAFWVSTLLTWGSKLVLTLLEEGLFGEVRYAGVFGSYTSITVLVSAISLLLLFSRMSFIKSRKAIAFLAPMSFSVYLIHENAHMVPIVFSKSISQIILRGVFDTVLLAFAYAITIYVVCSLIDFLRLKLFYLLHIKERLGRIEGKIMKRIGIT